MDSKRREHPNVIQDGRNSNGQEGSPHDLGNKIQTSSVIEMDGKDVNSTGYESNQVFQNENNASTLDMESSNYPQLERFTEEMKADIYSIPLEELKFFMRDDCIRLCNNSRVKGTLLYRKLHDKEDVDIGEPRIPGRGVLDDLGLSEEIKEDLEDSGPTEYCSMTVEDLETVTGSRLVGLRLHRRLHPTIIREWT
mmetsp:Transcript_32737/g.79642  ORF Transcript_32737/g.79642 Transcript_32737/m.79642 type:complete len:195 (-) Transcript_32737:258-842(-)